MDALEGFPDDGTVEQQVVWLKERVQRLHEQTLARMADIERRQAEMDRRLDAHERRIEEQARRIAIVEAKVDAVQRGEFLAEPLLELDEETATRH